MLPTHSYTVTETGGSGGGDDVFFHYLFTLLRQSHLLKSVEVQEVQ